jgi:hypothetical protein
MRAKGLITGALIIGCTAASPGARAATFSAEYLAGKWTTGSKENCAAAEHEQTVFRGDGTFATEHDGQAVAVGFFEVDDDDRMELQILASASSIEPALRQQLAGTYHYLPVEALVFDVADDSFRMVQSVAGQLQGLNVFRCP